MNSRLIAVVLVLMAVAGVVGYGVRAVSEDEEAVVPDARVESTETPEPTAEPSPEATQAPANTATPAPTSTDTPTPEPTSQPPVEITVATLRESDPEYSIDVEYPQMGLPFDATIKQAVEKAAQALRDLVQQSPPSSVGSPGPYSLTGGFESVYIGPDIVSVRLTFYSYTGGAHGGSAIHGFNFDRIDGHQLTLDDALHLIGLSLDDAAAQAKDQLTARLGDALFADGALPKPENYQTFVVGADSVTFIFQEYQVAPYAAGPQEVSLPRVNELH